MVCYPCPGCGHPVTWLNATYTFANRQDNAS
jgi:endogenous inhibitor of DNA gyrase (YacG/DUF329 family)